MSRWNLNSRIATAMLVATLASPAIAQTPIWSVEDAQTAMAQGEVILLDIRSAGEWAETGLAKGALPISMHEDGFIQKLQRVLSLGKPVAMICATGGRTQYVTTTLAKNGLSDVVDVSEGMMGNSRGAGWIAKGLPVVDIATAEAAYRALLPPN